ncbi:MAG TPA: transcription termination/antitermination NusG family protein [Verrucomicrobiae bacterium]|nr:transcription termination/antitermination NusG family protein [Verrucomicrobiae bacterium]
MEAVVSTSQKVDLAWYCARTKPRHEHIAAANVRKNLGLQVFLPQLRIERVTRRCLVRSVEPLFPCYIFVYCGVEPGLSEVRYANGVSTIVQFGGRIPTIPEAAIEELQQSFESDEPVSVSEQLSPGAEVVLTEGAFVGMHASVLRAMPVKQRVQVLFEILGRPTAVEVDRRSVALERNSLADLLPLLAAPHRELVRI